jgi:hypothetical protein
MLLKIILACWCVMGACLPASMAQAGQTDSPGQQPIGQPSIERTYDKFKDQTTVRLRPQTIRQITRPPEELSLSVETTYKGERATKPKDVDLIFESAAERYIYYNKADVFFVVDGKRIEAGTAYMMNAFPSPNLVKVKLKLTLPFDTFSEIAKGKEVELKIGPTEIRLAEKDLKALRAFATSVGEEPK